MKNKGRGKSERYVKLRLWLLDAPAWKSLPANARALYIELARRYNGSNNGRISYSVREAEQALRVSLSTASHLLRILQDRRFIVCTKRGAFSLKTTKDASEWQLTEYDCDHPVAHASKDFMRWRPPEGVDFATLNRQPSHHRKFKTRLPQPKHTVTPAEAHGCPSRSISSKKRKDDYPSRSIRAKNAPSTVTPAEHLQLPDRTGDDADEVATALPPAPLPASLPAPPWVPYSQRDIDHDRHSREGLMVYVADVIETQLRNLDEAKEAIETARETVPETMQPAADATTLHEMPADLSEQQRQDAERYFARWGDHARAYGWTAAQQDRLIRQIEGREVKQLTDTQALVGNKVFYRSQLGM